MFVWLERCGKKTCCGEKRGRRGFTLLEVLIATVILVTGIVALAGALSEGISAHVDAGNTETALFIAEGRLEEIRNTPFSSISDSALAPDGDFPLYSVAVNVTEGQEPLPVEVMVSWSGTGGGSPGLSVSTLVANLTSP